MPGKHRYSQTREARRVRTYRARRRLRIAECERLGVWHYCTVCNEPFPSQRAKNNHESQAHR